MPNENKNSNDLEVVLLSCSGKDQGMFSQKHNKTFWFAYAEIPTIPLIGNPFSTIRLSSVRNEPFPSNWVPGAKVVVKVSNITGKKGEGTFDVP